VTRTGGSTARAQTVYLQYGQQTAQGADYDALPTSVTFAAGQTTATLIVRPVDDTTVENTESVILYLLPTPLYRIGPNSAARINIADNDIAPPPVTPLISIAATDADAGEAGTNPGTFTLTRTGALNNTLTVRYTASGTAIAGADLAPLSGFAYFNWGAATTTITVTPYNDTFFEPTETVIVSVTDGAAYDLGTVHTATVNITSDDAPTQSPLPVLIVIANNDFYYQEYADPRTQLEAAGIPVVVAAGRRELSTPHSNSGQGSSSGQVMPDIALADVNAVNYSAIVFVGGWGASQYQYAFSGTYNNDAYNSTTAIRERVNQLINDFVAQQKLVTALCHGVSVLAWARVNGQSLLQGRTVSTYGGTSPASNVAAAQFSRWHSDVNGATVFVNGQYGNTSTAADDVIVDGRIITGENFDSGRLFGITLATQLRNSL